MGTVLTAAQIVETLREHRGELRQRFSVASIALFGSYAKDTQAEDSDLDFLVEFSQPSYDNFVELSTYLEQLFDRRVDLITPAGIDSIRIPEVADDIRRTLLHV
jgi:uncharacterized protein